MHHSFETQESKVVGFLLRNLGLQILFRSPNLEGDLLYLKLKLETVHHDHIKRITRIFCSNNFGVFPSASVLIRLSAVGKEELLPGVGLGDELVSTTVQKLAAS